MGLKTNQMKKQLLKKLYAFIVTAILFSVSANAQIIYTDVNPDIIQTCQTFQCSKNSTLDLNNDGVLDLKLDLILSTITRPTPPFLQYFNGSIKASPLNGSSILTNGSGYPLKMNLNEVINSNGSWSNSANQILIAKSYAGLTYVLNSSVGNWMNTINGFLGLKIVSGSQTYYGWVRLSININVPPTIGSFKIIDYAYNSISNQPILAGQTTCALPTVNVSASGATTFCYGSPLTLTADSASGYTFQWQKNTIAISGATARTYKVTTSGNYTVTTTSTCSIATSAPLSCTRIFNQTPVISTTDSLAYCAGQAINTKFTANTYTGVTYQWQKNSVNINGAIAPNFTATTTGNFRVRETANGCTRNSSAKSIVINCRIGEDFSNESILSVYPNPANNYITVQFPSAQSAIISITNLFGQLVYSEKVLPITSGTAQTQIDVSRFAAGMYMIRWSSEENFETKTFSVIK